MDRSTIGFESGGAATSRGGRARSAYTPDEERADADHRLPAEHGELHDHFG
jgi:hypothetical protein